MTQDNMNIKSKYRGNTINDFQAYLECRKHIAADFQAKHFQNLKRYYRRAFLTAPFRKGCSK